MRAMHHIIIIFVLAIINVFSASAQELITHDGCIDQFGLPVISILKEDFPTVAAATRLVDGTPVVYYNPNALSWFTRQTCLFCYAHECAHHVLGHTIGDAYPMTMEQEADCWAIRELYQSGQVNRNDVQIISDDIARLLGSGSWVHLPGPARAINLFGCLESLFEDEQQAGSEGRQGNRESNGGANLQNLRNFPIRDKINKK